MLQETIKDPLARYLRICCNPNSQELLDTLGEVLRHQVGPEEAKKFRQQLADVILHNSMIPEMYQKLTSDNEYPTQDKVQKRMLEIWKAAYGDAPVAESGLKTTGSNVRPVSNHVIK